MLHHPEMDYLPLPASLASLGRTSCTQFSTFPQLLVNQWIESQLPSCLHPKLPPPVWPPPSPPPFSLEHGLQVHLHTRSITGSKFALSWPPSAYLQTCSIIASKWISQDSLHHGVPVHLETRSITASKFAWLRSPSSYPRTHTITSSKFTRSPSPSASPNLLDHSLQVYLQLLLITASKFAWS